MSRLLSSFIVISSLIVIAGCTANVAFDPDAVDLTVQSSSGTPTPVDSGTLQPGQVIFYRVVTPSSVADTSDFVYYDIDVGQTGSPSDPNTFALRLYRASGSVLASSVSHEGFTSGTGAEALLPSSFEPQDIGVSTLCFGPCIVDHATTTVRYLRLENATGFEKQYDIFAFGAQAGDNGEPQNDSYSSPIALGASNSGAIETLGDQDYYEVTQDGTLNFTSTAASELQLRAEVLVDGSVWQTMAPGGSKAVLIGDVIRVYSASGWAGSTEASRYNLFY